MPMRVAIGVHGDGDARATLASVAARTSIDHDAFVLTERAAPAAFNALARNTHSDAIVFLEAGALVSTGWLDRLLAAMQGDVGLAGPSTNRSWNEQCAFPSATPHDVERIAGEASARFGSEATTLEPLYSLADFCFAVRREVIDAIGGADEAYATGPCWEMDYNIRAARAGWKGVWVRGAFVHRAPMTKSRALEETRRFEQSKRLYQDRFCGARLRGEKKDYRAHCRGDACPNFAPASLITINRGAAPASAAAEPLVSCIMPTRNRRNFARDSIQLFLRQDYANRELVIIDDGTDAIADLVPRDDRIRYIRRDPALTIGAKRNLACSEARGELIAHWDDDDWYPSWRLSTQVRALLGNSADVCGSSRIYFRDAKSGAAWEYCYPSASGWLAGTTLLYRKSFWERNRFTETNNGEDSAFVAARVPKVLHDLADSSLCVALLHDRNTATRPAGSLWKRCPIEKVRAVMDEEAQPLVSCIMPTYNRRAFVPLALTRFREQSYRNRELIIVDDGSDAIGDLVRDDPNVRYIRSEGRLTIGAKRNLACSEARGEIIAHWDDDDWYAPDRLERQVAPIVNGEADITGLENRFVLQMPDGRFWTIDARLHRSMFVCDVHGGTLVYRRSLFTAGLRYPEADLGEDAVFVRTAVSRGRKLVRVENDGMFVYMRHQTNAWRFPAGTFLDPRGWSETAPPAAFSASCLDEYLAASSASPVLHDR